MDEKIHRWTDLFGASLVAQMVKKTGCNVGDPGSIPGLGRYPGEGNGNLLHYSCLENSMDREDWWAKVHGGHKELDMTKQLTFPNASYRILAVNYCTNLQLFCIFSNCPIKMLGSYDVTGLCLLVETVDFFGRVHWLRFSTNGS